MHPISEKANLLDQLSSLLLSQPLLSVLKFECLFARPQLSTAQHPCVADLDRLSVTTTDLVKRNRKTSDHDGSLRSLRSYGWAHCPDEMCRSKD